MLVLSSLLALPFSDFGFIPWVVVRAVKLSLEWDTIFG